jgi:uncharacterized protein (TIGR03435 family)
MRISLLAALVVCTLMGQEWEVAAIKLNRSNTTDSNLDSAPGGRLTATNITLRELVRLAFDVKDYQIERAPAWIDAERFDINAKAANTRKANLGELQALVCALLEDRFRLRTHA